MSEISQDYLYYRDIFCGRSMPFAFVDMDLFEENIQDILRRAGDKKIRIASKSIRCVALLQHILKSSSRFQGIMCYSAEEAVHLSREGMDDLLVAYPVLDDKQITNACQELQKGKCIIFMVDCQEHAARLNDLGRAARTRIPIAVDIDMSSDYGLLHFGVWRSPIVTTEPALSLCEYIASRDYLALQGIMGYEAQIAGLPDKSPLHGFLTQMVISLLKKISHRKVKKRRREIVSMLRERGFSLNIVNGGGTGSLESTREEDWITEMTAGSGFFSPVLFDYYRCFRHLPAAGYAIQITRRPRKNIFTCHGGGYIASGPGGKDRLPLPYLPTGARLTAAEGAGEVQTPVFYDGEQNLDLGDPIFMRHAKAGELCEHFNTLILISKGSIIGEVPTYRGQGHCFL